MRTFNDIKAAEALAQVRDLILSDDNFDCAVAPSVLAKQLEALIDTIISTSIDQRFVE